jgi:hypothetical protein
VGAIITNEQVEALPLEGRNVASLVVIAGAAVDTGNPSSRSLTQSRGIAIAGGQSFGVAYVLDGALHNNVYDGTGLPLPFPDAMQEFKVETSSQNAQNGYKAGGTVGVATKSGTNIFHGDVFEFARHHRFNCDEPLRRDQQDHRQAQRRRSGAQPVRRRAGRPDRQRQALLLCGVSGHARDPDSGRHRHLHPDGRDAAGDFSTVASAQCRAQGNLVMPAALGSSTTRSTRRSSVRRR